MSSFKDGPAELRVRSAPEPPAYASIPVELPVRFAQTDVLAGRRAIVTGGGRGLGLAITCAFADAGARVAVIGRHAEYLELALTELERRGKTGKAVLGDVVDVASVRDAVREAAASLGGVDLLVNNAGVASRKPPEELLEEEFDRMFDTNVRGVYYASCEAVRAMPDGGAIANVASVAATLPDVELAAYSASKAAVVQLTRAFAAAWGARGIRVNAVSPGYTDSPLNAHRKADSAKAEAIVGRTPLGRWGKPADVANAVVFVCSEAASFVTGQEIVVDGGYSAVK